MKIRCNALFPGEVVDGLLVEEASQVSMDSVEVRLEVRSNEGTSIQLPPPAALGAEVMEATPAELDALEAAGYRLKSPAAAKPVAARYSFGNPYAPMGIGGYTVDVKNDGAVTLVHERHGVRRVWRARAESALWTELERAITTSGFPKYAGDMSAPPGSASFSFAVTNADGVNHQVGGFGAIEYRDVNLLFNRIVSQMSQAEVFGIELPSDERYVGNVVLES